MKLTADRLDRISPSLTIAITAKARALKAAGRDVIGLSAGEPDFDTPQNVKDAAIAAIQRGETKYTDVAGTMVLRQAVGARFKADHGLDFKPEEILVATGGKQVIFDALLATINPGDEAIIPAPCWVTTPTSSSWPRASRSSSPATRIPASRCGRSSWKRRSRRRPSGC